jgi:hypothetical protein
VEVEVAIPQAHLVDGRRLGRDEGPGGGIGPRQVLDDDRGFRRRHAGLGILQNRHHAERRERAEPFARRRVAQVHVHELERQAAFVEGDQAFPAVGRQKMAMETKGHRTTPLLRTPDTRLAIQHAAEKTKGR